MTDLFSSDLPPEFLASMPEFDSGYEQIVNALPSSSSYNITQQMARAVKLKKLIEESNKNGGIAKWFSADSIYPIWETPKHMEFFAAGKDYPERMFMAANRVGKSICGAYESTVHLTGDYPTWWNGKVFDHPVDGWAVGPDAVTVRDTIQKELLGPAGSWGTGMIPAAKLGKFNGRQGVPGAIDTIYIKHRTGGWSSLGFKNYKQDIQAFMGTSRHFVWCDEECPIEIWNECNIRTATTKGIMLATFTPLQGLTRMVINFCKNADYLAGAKPMVGLSRDTEDGEEAVGFGVKKAVIQAGWDDAPWLDEETKSRLLQDTPPHLRDARSKGIPSLEGGNVYITPIENVLVDPFLIPDSWPRMYGLDAGWNRTAAVWCALDPNSDTVYLYDEHYKGELEPQYHAVDIASRGDWIPGAIDPATRGRSQVDGQKLLRLYKDNGLKVFPAKNERESGIQALQQRLGTGRFKVFKTCRNWAKEYVIYRRKENGSVIDEDDHAMDATRYVINNMNRMMSKAQVRPSTLVGYTATRYDI